MIRVVDTFVVVVMVAALFSVAVAVLAFLRPTLAGGRFLGLNFIGTAIWCPAYAAELQARSLSAKLIWGQIAYIGIVIVGPSWVLFSLSYLGVRVRRSALLLYVIPLLTVAFVFAYPKLPWVWTAADLLARDGIRLLIVDHGPWFWVHTLFSYSCLVLGSVALVVGVHRRARGFTKQAAVIALVAIVSWLANFVSIMGFPPLGGLDITPIGVVFSSLIITLGALRLRILEIFPAMVSVAHEAVLREMRDGVIVTDDHGRVLNANEAASRLLGATREVVGEPLTDVLTFDVGPLTGINALDLAAAEGDQVRAGVSERPAVALDAVVSRLGADERWRGYTVVLRDVSEREATARALKASEERLRVLFTQSPVALLVFDGDLRVTECNDLMAGMIGATVNDLQGARLTVAIASSLLPLLEQALRGEQMVYDGPFIRESGEELWIESRVSPLYLGDAITGGMIVAWDVTRTKRAEALIERLAFHDTLTGLPNRSLFRDRLRQAIDESDSAPVIVAILDVDRFKMINDAIGHTTADEVLQLLAKRLEAVLGRGDTLARVAGDEMGFLFTGLSDSSAAVSRAEEVLAVVREPWHLGGQTFGLTVSIGLAVYPGDSSSAYGLIENAERALWRARDAGGDRYQFYDLSMNLAAAERLEIEQGLRTALLNDELVLYYEPQVDLNDGRVRGVEALVRWNHPTRGVLPPIAFIPVAEESGIIGRIGEWVLRRACETIAATETDTPLRVAVNLSPRDLKNRKLAAVVQQILRESGLPPERLEIELTETAVIEDLEASCRALESLQSLGVAVVLDDFGTGYASLSHLHVLPIDKVKIDRSFVMRCEVDHDAANIIEALVALAHKLHVRVVAEGVEKRGQADYLRGLGCDEAQGYYFGRPQPAAESPAFARGERLLYPRSAL